MSHRCLISSGYWKVDRAYHWSNTTGGIVYTVTGSKLSRIDCADICLYNSDCLMFGYSNVTGTCRGFRYLEHNPVSILEESEVIYKHTQCCHLAGYIWMEDGSLCVRIHNNSVTWYHARNLCVNDHGRLAILDDAKKHQAFFDYIGDDYKYDAWLGVNDLKTDGSRVWLYGADLNTSYWPLVELNDNTSTYLPNQANADCGATMKNRGILDIHCLDKIPFICQRIDLE
ncbi:tetranectin-like [Argopecten irradians]|uniref:tetranectin-like n=1 Tax=Argopecten irradians TaxID=31199 RepID=UPI0037159118